MSIKARIEKLETRRTDEEDAVTLGEIVWASYLSDDDPRLLELEERFSRSSLVALIVEAYERGRQDEASSAGEAKWARLH